VISAIQTTDEWEAWILPETGALGLPDIDYYAIWPNFDKFCGATDEVA
jgi:hypothetical protein